MLPCYGQYNQTRLFTFSFFFSTGHILTISPTVKRICPSTGEYIMHADPPPNFNLDGVNDSMPAFSLFPPSSEVRLAGRRYFSDRAKVATSAATSSREKERLYFSYFPSFPVIKSTLLYDYCTLLLHQKGFCILTASFCKRTTMILT